VDWLEGMWVQLLAVAAEEPATSSAADAAAAGASPEPSLAQGDPGETESGTFGLPRGLFTVVCLGVVLILLAALFMVRRFLGMIMNVVFLLMGTTLVIVALFGHQLGIFDAIAELAEAGRQQPTP